MQSEIKPLKIWAAAGALAAAILGTTSMQLRSTGSSLAEVAAHAYSASNVGPTSSEVNNSSSNSTVYEAGYIGNRSGFISPLFRTNALARPAARYNIPTFGLQYSGTDAENDPEPSSDVTHDLLLPQFAQADGPAEPDEIDQHTPYLFATNYVAPVLANWESLAYQPVETTSVSMDDIPIEVIWNPDDVSTVASSAGGLLLDDSAQAIALGNAITVVAAGNVIEDVSNGQAVPGWVHRPTIGIGGAAGVNPQQAAIQVPLEARAYLGDSQAQAMVMQQAMDLQRPASVESYARPQAAANVLVQRLAVMDGDQQAAIQARQLGALQAQSTYEVEVRSQLQSGRVYRDNYW